MQFAVDKMLDSATCRGLQRGEVERLVRSLATEAPHWMAIVRAGQQEYIKLTETDINTIVKRLEKARDSALEQ